MITTADEYDKAREDFRSIYENESISLDEKIECCRAFVCAITQKNIIAYYGQILWLICIKKQIVIMNCSIL